MDNETKNCSTCNTLSHLEAFTKEGKVLKTCIACREMDKKKKSNPITKEKRKQQQKEQKYWIKHRQNRRDENETEYLKRNAEFMVNWRQNNKEHHRQWQRQNLKHKLYSLKNQARKKNIEWKDEMTDEICKNFMTNACFYCGSMDDDGLNGIDRMDNNKCYELINCVPCCKKCNFMKKTLDAKTFIERCLHISCINGATGELRYEAWTDCNRSPYMNYKYRAEKKGLIFEISETTFYTICSQECYYCKRGSTKTNKNGIDRMDNNIGYTLSNLVACCAECNFMKAQLSDGDFILQCQKVSTKFNTVAELPNTTRCFSVISKRSIKV
jgi:ribosome-binding protein aMBF1 (putative translation factor)